MKAHPSFITVWLLLEALALCLRGAPLLAGSVDEELQLLYPSEDGGAAPERPLPDGQTLAPAPELEPIVRKFASSPPGSSPLSLDEAVSAPALEGGDPEEERAAEPQETTDARLLQAADLQGRRVSQVEVELQGPYRQHDLTSVVVVQEGEPLKLPDVGRSIELLFRLGAIDDVVAEARLEADGVRVVFKVWPSLIVKKVTFHGNRQIIDRRLRAQLSLRALSVFHEEDARLQAELLTRFYRLEGYYAMRITPEVKTSSRGQVAIAYEIREGEPARISRLLFEGCEAFSPRALQQAVGLEEGQIFRQRELEDYRKAVQQFYRDRGYLGARVKASRDIEQNGASVALRFEINEGPQIDFEFYSRRLPQLGPMKGAVWYRVYLRMGLGEGDKAPRRVSALGQRHWMKVLDPKHEQYFSAGFMEEAAELIRHSLVTEGFNGAAVIPEQVVRDEGRSLTFRFIIDPGRLIRIGKVTLQGNRYFDDQILEETFREAMMRFAPEHLFTEDATDQAIALMEEYYRSHGFLQARLSRAYEIKGAPPPVISVQSLSKKLALLKPKENRKTPQIKNEGLLQAHIRISVVEGPRTLIRELRLEGCRALPLEEVASTVELQSGDPYDALRLRRAERQIKEFYQARGYPGAQVLVTVTRDPDSPQSVSVLIEVDEGIRAQIGEVIVRGARRTRAKVLTRELMLRSGDPYLLSNVEESKSRLNSTGLFDRVTIYPTPGERVRDVIVEVHERPSKSLSFSSGFLLENFALGFQSAQFDSTLELTHHNLFGVGHRVSARVDLSTSYLPDIRSRAAEEGLFPYTLGIAEDLFAYLEQAASRRLVVSYQSPYLLGFRLNSILSLTAFERKQLPTYLLERNSATWGLSRRYSPRLNLSLQAQAALRNLDLERTEPVVLLWDEDKGQRLFLQGSLVTVFDQRNSDYSRGFVVTAQEELIQAWGCDAEWNSLRLCQGDLSVSDVLARFTASGALLIPSPVSWLRGELRANAGYIAPLQGTSGEVPVERRFYLGGAGSVRGYLQDSLGPARLRASSLPSEVVPGYAWIPTGGNLLGAYSLEAWFALETLSDWFEDMDLALFHDAGNVFWTGEARTVFDEAVQADSLEPDLAIQQAGGEACWNLRTQNRGPSVQVRDLLRYSVGTGLRYRTSIGLIRLDLGLPLFRVCEEEERYAIHFSIGVF